MSAVALGEPAPDSPPTDLAGYQAVCELGRGAMGVVWLARDLTLNRLVALKRINATADPMLGARLLREGRAVAQLQHRHIVTIHALGETVGGAFLVMELLEGGDLQTRIDERRLTPREAAELVAKIADALAHAHASGVLHRDIKPSNILLDAADEPHLADFGLAAPLLGGGDLTATGQIAGTPAFLAPELLKGSAHASPQSDVYSLGAVLYACLTGRPPFVGENAAAILAQIASSDPPPPRSLQRDLPRDVETICLACLEKIPARRYASAEALRDDLKRFLDGEPVNARPLGFAEKTLRWCQRHPAVTATLAFLALAGAMVTWQIASRNIEHAYRAVVAMPSEGVQLTAKARALYEKVGFSRDDLAAAADLARRATEQEPGSATAWGVRAGAEAAWIFRGWDYSEKRLQDIQSFASRAHSLQPDEPEALVAIGYVLYRQDAFDQAEAVFRRGIAANPDHVRLVRALGSTLRRAGRDADAHRVLLDAARRFPRDRLVHYDLALSFSDYTVYRGEPNLTAALQHLDAAIAIEPFSSALVLKATLVAGWRGDLPAMRAVLAQQETLPLSERSDDRAVYVAMWAGVLEQRADRVEAAAALTARTYFDDWIVPLHPKAWLLALAHQATGKENRARADWQAAENVLRQRVKDAPGDMICQMELAITLAWLGQHDEATRLLTPIEAVWREDPRFSRSRLLALYYGAVGDAAKAAIYLPQVIDRAPFSSRKLMPIDPWWYKLRSQPAFETLLKGPASEP